MALSNKRILEEMKAGNIIIEPFRTRNLSTSSYDVTLGAYYFRERPTKYHHHIYNIWSKDHTDHVWGTKPLEAEYARDVFKKYKFEWNGIKPSDRVILLEPGETVLAHTEEFIGGRQHITTMMKARSSLGRSFIEVCKCAGWGDVGYINRWTMEITNNSTRYAIPLVVGRRVAQIIFFDTGPVLARENDYTKNGKYQKALSLDALKRSWKPDMMIPKLYLDREIRK